MRALATGWLGALFVVISCGAPATSSTERVAVSVAGLIECDEVGLRATCHSCGHAVAGPFMPVTANAIDASVVFTSIDVVHTYYEIGLTSTAVAGEHAGAVTYFPNSEELHAYAFHMSSPVELHVFDEAGNEVPVGLEHPIRADTDCLSIGYPSLVGCDQHLPVVKVFELTGAAPYKVTLGPTAATSVALVVENLDSIGGWFAPDMDGDGRGDQAAGQSSWCAELPGYVGNSDDCDDGDPTVYYDASELCDGVDNNCDEVSDAEDPTLCAESSDGRLCLVTGETAQCGCADDDDCDIGSECVAQRCEIAGGALDASVPLDGSTPLDGATDADADAPVEEASPTLGEKDAAISDAGLEPSEPLPPDDEPGNQGGDGEPDAGDEPIARDAGDADSEDDEGDGSPPRRARSGCSVAEPAFGVSWAGVVLASPLGLLAVLGMRRRSRGRVLQVQLD